MTERYSLAKERVEEIITESKGLGIYSPFFESLAKFTKGLLDIYEDVKSNGNLGNHSLEELEERNKFLYSELTDKYASSFLNPDYAFEVLDENGKYLSALFAEIHGMIPYVFEVDLEEIVIRLELLLEFYSTIKNALDDNEEVKSDSLKDILYYYVFDYTEDESVKRIGKQLTIDNAYANNIIEHYDLTDVRTLYAFGEYVGQNEIETFKALAELDEDTIALMSSTFTEGFKRGFVVSKKDMSKKKTVNLRYRLGFERVAKKSIEEFRAMGLESVIYRAGY
nr:leucyl aminopeptidase [Lachnospiraceae bacterium]